MIYTEFWNPSTNTFSEGYPLGEFNSQHCATEVEPNQVFVGGGWSSSAGRTAWIYNLENGAAEHLTDMPHHRWAREGDGHTKNQIMMLFVQIRPLLRCGRAALGGGKGHRRRGGTGQAYCCCCYDVGVVLVIAKTLAAIVVVVATVAVVAALLLLLKVLLLLCCCCCCYCCY